MSLTPQDKSEDGSRISVSKADVEEITDLFFYVKSNRGEEFNKQDINLNCDELERVDEDSLLYDKERVEGQRSSGTPSDTLDGRNQSFHIASCSPRRPLYDPYSFSSGPKGYELTSKVISIDEHLFKYVPEPRELEENDPIHYALLSIPTPPGSPRTVYLECLRENSPQQELPGREDSISPVHGENFELVQFPQFSFRNNVLPPLSYTPSPPPPPPHPSASYPSPESSIGADGARNTALIFGTSYATHSDSRDCHGSDDSGRLRYPSPASLCSQSAARAIETSSRPLSPATAPLQSSISDPTTISESSLSYSEPDFYIEDNAIETLRWKYNWLREENERLLESRARAFRQRDDAISMLEEVRGFKRKRVLDSMLHPPPLPRPLPAVEKGLDFWRSIPKISLLPSVKRSEADINLFPGQFRFEPSIMTWPTISIFNNAETLLDGHSDEYPLKRLKHSPPSPTAATFPPNCQEQCIDMFSPQPPPLEYNHFEKMYKRKANDLVCLPCVNLQESHSNYVAATFPANAYLSMAVEEDIVAHMLEHHIQAYANIADLPIVKVMMQRQEFLCRRVVTFKT